MDLILKCYMASQIKIVGNELWLAFLETNTWILQELELEGSCQDFKSHIIDEG